MSLPRRQDSGATLRSRALLYSALSRIADTQTAEYMMPRVAAACPIVPNDCDEPIIKELIAQLNTGSPTYVTVSPQRGCEEGKCFWNVDKMIKLSHGKPVYGWCIWYWPGYYARAEHHCIWEKADGTCIDPTPKAEGNSRILFALDANATPENIHPIRRSVWVVEGQHPDNLKLVDLSKRSEDLRFYHHRSSSDKEREAMVDEYWKIERKIEMLIGKIGVRSRLRK